MSRSRLQDELKKQHAFVSLEQEATLNLFRTSDHLEIQFARLFREHGLTSAHYNILRILRGEGKPLPILEIASRTITVVPGITGLIDRMEKAELVRRERCETDRRVIFVALTEKAHALVSQLEPLVLELHQQVMKPLSHEELKELSRILEKLRVKDDETD
jgi:MarR family transcriptional regulator, 2-MHQ and catechol-resistance regulon repressor